MVVWRGEGRGVCGHRPFAARIEGEFPSRTGEEHGRMALNIKNRDVEELAAEVAKMTGETKTEAIRRALAERHQRLGGESGPTARAEPPRRVTEVGDLGGLLAARDGDAGGEIGG